MARHAAPDEPPVPGSTGSAIEKRVPRLQPFVKATLHEVTYAEPQVQAREATTWFPVACRPWASRSSESMEQLEQIVAPVAGVKCENG
jgi:hypothetical protein